MANHYDHGHGGHHGRSRLSRRRIAAIVLGAALVYAGALVGIETVGSRLEKKDATEPRGSLEGRFTSTAPTMEYGGRSWTYRERDLTNLLLIGVDWEESGETAAGRYAGQADFLLIVTIDKENKTVSAVQLDRDTMTDIRIYGPFGNYTGIQSAQLCLSYAYGEDSEENCENTVWAVSRLMGNIPLDGYLALDMSSIAIFNDALGGVTVTLEDDFSAFDPQMTQGTTLTLQGKQAEYFVRGRMSVGDGTNASRMRRQQAFIQAAEQLLAQRINEDANYIGELYDALEGHAITSFKRGWLINAAYESRAYQRMDTVTPAGEHSTGVDGFMEFHVDANALNELLTERYFE